MLYFYFIAGFRKDNNNNNNNNNDSNNNDNNMTTHVIGNVKASLLKNQRLESAYAICPAFGLDFALSIQAR